MSISVGQVKGNPKEAAQMIAMLEAEIERLRALLTEAAPYVDRARISTAIGDPAVVAHNKRCLDLLARIASQQSAPGK